jgi:hypothetical protein
MTGKARLLGLIVLGLTLSIGFVPTNVAQAISSSVDLSATIAGGGTTGNVKFTGDAFPNALVTILMGGSVVGTTSANGLSAFNKTIININAGVHTFSLYAQNGQGKKTVTISFNANVIANATITFSGILLSPIVTVPDSIKRPESLTESGVAKQASTVTTFTHSDTITKQTGTDGGGNWAVTINDVLHLGSHNVTALVIANGGAQSELTNPIDFLVKISADLNIDTRVNLTDFSILMFSYGQNNPGAKASDINDDTHVDLIDFSVMMFYWTGLQ